MRRLILLAGVALLALTLPVAEAAAVKGVRASFTNATDEPLKVVVRIDDRRTTRTLDPGEALDRVTAPGGFFGADVWFELGSCGTLHLSNAFVGAPQAALFFSDTGGSRGWSFSEGESRRMSFSGTRAVVERRADTDDFKELAVRLEACGDELVLTPNLGMKAVRASFTNDTDAAVRIVPVTGDDDDDRGPARTVAPGETVDDLSDRGRRAAILGIEAGRCGAVVLVNPSARTPYAALNGRSRGKDSVALDERESRKLAADGLRYAVTRKADAGDAKEFEVTLELCR